MSSLNGLQAERMIAKHYEERGYAVTTEPPPSAIPFSLGNYKPDILAIRGDENLIIEVKGPGARVDSSVYLRLDEEVQLHPGWRFLLVTVGEEELRQFAASTSSNLSVNMSIEAMRERIHQMDQLLDTPNMAGFLLPRLWLAYVSALRLNAAREGVSQEGLTDLSLINMAYSEGIISIAEYESGRRFLNLRNHTVHNLDANATVTECKELRQMIDVVLHRLENLDS